MKSLPLKLRSLVGESVALLGEVIRRELGEVKFRRIESLRLKMAGLRGADHHQSSQSLRQAFESLQKLSRRDQQEIARAFTLMLELMNVCENAFRSDRLSQSQPSSSTNFNTPESDLPKAIIYVLTAHPTEARSPQNIAVFHEIQRLLIQVLKGNRLHPRIQFAPTDKEMLMHWLEIAWRAPIVRSRKPRVKDEAEHIYSMLFREEIFQTLLDRPGLQTPFFVRSWVGGDKDGHPGVDEVTLQESLQLSRKMIFQAVRKELQTVRATLDLVSDTQLKRKFQVCWQDLSRLRVLRTGDAKSLMRFRKSMLEFKNLYLRSMSSLHPSLQRLSRLFHSFPGLVVTLELRESSEVLMATHARNQKQVAIFRMLRRLSQIAQGGDPRWYARGLIISMADSFAHIQAAARLQMSTFGEIRLPIIPLFEEAASLQKSEKIVRQMVGHTKLHRASRKYWGGLIEIMVGYSDSAKEAGVFSSRWAIAQALPKLEKVCQRNDLEPVFFHGSGGSIDRGGGSIEDQTAWWPAAALRRYKVTVQGEMVERSLATPEIARRQLEKIETNMIRGLRKPHLQFGSSAIDSFVEALSEAYRQQVTDPEFLTWVEAATPYLYLNLLKIGSRPSKRTAQLTVKGLRAIPWILCWTQTRVLFPTWWGVGSAWEKMSASQKASLRKAAIQNPVFQSYIKALGFTLAKIEMPVFQIYLEQSSLTANEKKRAFEILSAELRKVRRCHRELTGKKNPLWFRPWLSDSIKLRSPMIHPLNLLQILSEQKNDRYLLRLTVTGIASGMLTTG